MLLITREDFVSFYESETYWGQILYDFYRKNILNYVTSNWWNEKEFVFSLISNYVHSDFKLQKLMCGLITLKILYRKNTDTLKS